MTRLTICADCGASMANTSDRYCALCFSIRLAPTEAETVKRIVAWLRADQPWRRELRDYLADAIERGDWKAGGGRDG